MGRKHFLLPVLAGAFLLLAGNAGWALTAYVTGMGEEDAVAIDPATIQDVASGHRTADVYDVQIGYEVHIGKMEFDCAGRRVQTLSEKRYESEDAGLKFLADEGPADWIAVPNGSILEGALVFVCGWPQISPDATKIPDVANIQQLFNMISNHMMGADDDFDSKK